MRTSPSSPHGSGLPHPSVQQGMELLQHRILCKDARPEVGRGVKGGCLAPTGERAVGPGIALLWRELSQAPSSEMVWSQTQPVRGRASLPPPCRCDP